MPFANETEKRATNRIRYTEPVQYQHTDPHQFGGCLASDISETGIRVNLNEFVPIDSHIWLNVELDDKRIVECMGRVVWIEQIPYSDRYRAGLEFSKEQSTFDSRQAIHKYVESHQT